MKRIVKQLLTVCLFAALVCATVYAGEIAATEFNSLNLADDMAQKLTLTFYNKAGNQEAPIEEDANNPGRYFEAIRGSLTYSAATKGQRYVLMITSSELTPTRGLVDEELAFIREKTADGDTVTIDFYPGDMDNGKRYYVYLSGSGSDSFRKLAATFAYKDYLLGDVNTIVGIDPDDALTVLNMSVTTEPTYEDWQYKAADVNRDNKIDAQDALYILQKAAYPDMSFPSGE